MILYIGALLDCKSGWNIDGDEGNTEDTEADDRGGGAGMGEGEELFVSGSGEGCGGKYESASVLKDLGS